MLLEAFLDFDQGNISSFYLQYKVVGLRNSACDRVRPSLLDFPFADLLRLAAVVILVIVGHLPTTTCQYIYYISIHILGPWAPRVLARTPPTEVL